MKVEFYFVSGGEVVKTEELNPSKPRLMSPDVDGEISLSSPLSLLHCTHHQCSLIKQTNKIIMARGMLGF